MGGKPVFALAILGMPLGKIAPEQVRDILEDGREVCSAAGIPVAGGHSIDTPEPIYGLAVSGLCAPSELRRNCDAKPGDVLILTKPVGDGVCSAAFKKDALSAADYRDMIAMMTRLNRVGAKLSKEPGRACHDRCHGVRHSRPRPRNGARFGPQRVRDRSFGPELGQLRA
jgi:selenide,water dikinase